MLYNQTRSYIALTLQNNRRLHTLKYQADMVWERCKKAHIFNTKKQNRKKDDRWGKTYEEISDEKKLMYALISSSIEKLVQERNPQNISQNVLWCDLLT